LFAKSPLDKLPEKLGRESLVDAIRTAIIAELDAINFYLQIASRASDPEVRRVFEDVAREEKAHVGEFLALLEKLDPEQARMLEEGRKEVEELTSGQGS